MDPPSALPHPPSPRAQPGPPKATPAHRCPQHGLSQPSVPVSRWPGDSCPCVPLTPKPPVCLLQARCLPCSPAGPHSRLSQHGLGRHWEQRGAGSKALPPSAGETGPAPFQPQIPSPTHSLGPGGLPAPTPGHGGGRPWLPNNREAAAPTGWARAAWEERGNWGFSLVSCFKMHFMARGGEGSGLQLRNSSQGCGGTVGARTDPPCSFWG